MLKNNINFDEALEQAKLLGYAEADPSSDIGGLDSAYKANILSSLCFKLDYSKTLAPDNFENFYIEGIENITSIEIKNADRLGYVIKPIVLGLNKFDSNEPNKQTEVLLATFPALINKNKIVANINSVENIVQLESNLLGEINYTGHGAGGQVTAASVLADLDKIINNPELDLKYFYNLSKNTNIFSYLDIKDIEFSFFAVININKEFADHKTIDTNHELINKIKTIADDSKVKINTSYYSDPNNTHDYNDNDQKNPYIILMTDVILNSKMDEFKDRLLEDKCITSMQYLRVLD